MTDPYLRRIRALPDAELLLYLKNQADYRIEAVEGALAELDRRNLDLPDEQRSRIRESLTQREAAARARLDRSFVKGLGTSLNARLARIRLIAGSLLAAGYAIALATFLLIAPGGTNPLGFEPEDSKKYLRDMEVYGGKVNLLASQIRGAWSGLWHGRNLAFTIAALSTLLALAFWFLATRRAKGLDGIQE
jgi:hypothetical protein